MAERVLPLLFLLLMTKSSPFAFKPLLVVSPTIYSVILATMVPRANSRLTHGREAGGLFKGTAITSATG